MMAAAFGACRAFSDRPSPAVNGVSPRSTHSPDGTLRPAFSTARFCTGRALSPMLATFPVLRQSAAPRCRFQPIHPRSRCASIRSALPQSGPAPVRSCMGGRAFPRPPPNHPRSSACIEWRCPTLPNRKPSGRASLAPPPSHPRSSACIEWRCPALPKRQTAKP